MKRKRTLYVYKTTFQQLWYMWDVKPFSNWEGKDLYIQCNIKGIPNWNKGLVYLNDDLINRLHKVVND